jgi:hypothetical protein
MTEPTNPPSDTVRVRCREPWRGLEHGDVADLSHAEAHAGISLGRLELADPCADPLPPPRIDGETARVRCHSPFTFVAGEKGRRLEVGEEATVPAAVARDGIAKGCLELLPPVVEHGFVLDGGSSLDRDGMR